MKKKYFPIIVFVIFSIQICVVAQEKKITFPLTVLDEKNILFPDLKVSDFLFSSGKSILRVDSLVAKAPNSLEIVILMDVSISQERVLQDEKLATEYFIDTILKNGDRVAICKFSEDVSCVQDLTTDFQAAKIQLGKIQIVRPPGYVGGGIVAGSPPTKGGTAPVGASSMWDSLIRIAKLWNTHPSGNVRRAIFLISDGVNTWGAGKMKESIHFLIKSNTPVYAVGIGDDYFSGVDKGTLKKLTERTSGLLVSTNSSSELKADSDLSNSYKKMEQNLRFGYDVTFTFSPKKGDDGFHELNLKIINPELKKRKLQIVKPKGFFVTN